VTAPDVSFDAERPWVHLATGFDPADVGSPADRQLVVRLEGRSLRNVDTLFAEFAREFQFPQYFGENWPAFADCMTDLTWLPAPAYLVVIDDAEQVLSEDSLDFPTFVRIMSHVGEHWGRPYGHQAPHVSGAIPFNLVLVVTPERLSEMAARIQPGTS
jgi:RNAse (barnase) inhibitor barstar